MITTSIHQAFQQKFIRQLEYWFSKKPHGFYKFTEPCNHALYKDGDSWSEELGVHRKTFNKRFSQIGVVYSSKKSFDAVSKSKGDPFHGKAYARYYDRYDNRTYYLRNHSFADTFIKRIFGYKKVLKNKKNNLFQRLSQTTQSLVQAKTQKQVSKVIADSHRKSEKSPLRNGQKVRSINNKDITTKSLSKDLVRTPPSKKERQTDPFSKIKNISTEHTQQAQKMIESWKKATEDTTLTVQLTNSLASRLRNTLRQFFQGSLGRWYEYCKKIASSKFLMGEKTKFKAWLSWVIKPEIIARVEDREFDIGDRTPQADLRERNRTDDLIEHIQNCSGPVFWKEALTCILNRVGAPAFRSWIKPLQFLEESESIIKLQAPSKFCATWVQEKYDSLFVEALSVKGIRRISILSESS